MLVKFFASYREITKCSSCVVPAPHDLRALLSEITVKYGPAMGGKLLSEDGQALGNDAVVLVNGRHIDHLTGLDTLLFEDDVVALFPLVAGG